MILFYLNTNFEEATDFCWSWRWFHRFHCTWNFTASTEVFDACMYQLSRVQK